MLLCNGHLVNPLFSLGIRTSSYSKSRIAGRVSGLLDSVILKKEINFTDTESKQVVFKEQQIKQLFIFQIP